MIDGWMMMDGWMDDDEDDSASRCTVHLHVIVQLMSFFGWNKCALIYGAEAGKSHELVASLLQASANKLIEFLAIEPIPTISLVARQDDILNACVNVKVTGARLIILVLSSLTIPEVQITIMTTTTM